MNLILNLILLLTYSLFFVSCTGSEIDVELHSDVNKTAPPNAPIEIQNVSIQNNQLILQGMNLEGISTINVQGPNSFNENFIIESQVSNQIIANGLRNITFVIGHTFSFLISDAQAASSFTVDFVPQAGSPIGDFKSDGSVVMSGNIDAGSQKLTNLSGADLKGDLSTSLTGTVDVTGGTTALVGTGTLFTTELMVGNAIKIGAEIFTISAITNNTNLTLDSNHIAGATSVTATTDTTILSLKSGDDKNYFSVLGNGKVGIGTSTPNLKFSVIAGTDTENIAEFFNASNKGLRIVNNGAGQTPSLIFYSGATSRLAINPPGGCCNAARINSNGNFVFNPGGANNWSGVGFPAAADPSAKWEIDGTGGTLPLFKISSHADVNPQGDILVVDNAGDVGIGVTTPTEKLHILGNLRVQGATDCILGSGSGATNCTSDKRLKNNIKVITKAVEKLKKIRGVSFDWNELSLSEGSHSIGVIAQEVQKVFPTAVIENPDTGYLMVDYAVLTAPLIQAVVEQEKEIKLNKFSAAREIFLLKEENKNLKKGLDELKALMCQQSPNAKICQGI